VKKRSLLMIVAMLSALLLGMGTAYAVTAVDDAVPGQDVIIPIICEGFQPDDQGGNPVGDPVFLSLNTIWAIAETSGDSCVLDASVCVPKDMNGIPKDNVPGVAVADVVVYDRLSIPRLDVGECWSKHDVISNQCTDMITAMTAIDRDHMEITINNVPYFVGYVIYNQTSGCNRAYPGTCASGDIGCVTGQPRPPAGSAFVKNRFVPWIYLNDVVKGFASGFNGVSAENGTSAGLTEHCTDGSCQGLDIGVTAATVFPRYYILNGDPDTYTMWIILLGRNEYKQEYLNGNIAENNLQRVLSCYFCDENEVCKSNGVPIPYELNVLNVAGYIPGSVWPTSWPITDPSGKRGFAYCDVYEHGSFTSPGLPGFTTGTSFTINGTVSFDGIDSDAYADSYSLFAWSYQRAFPVAPLNTKLAVVHPIHRLYCSSPATTASAGVAPLPARFSDGTVASCSITQP